MFLNVLFRECGMSHWTPMSWCLYVMWKQNFVKHRMQLCVWGSALCMEIPTSLLRNTFLLRLPDFRPLPWVLTVGKWCLLGAERTRECDDCKQTPAHLAAAGHAVWGCVPTPSPSQLCCPTSQGVYCVQCLLKAVKKTSKQTKSPNVAIIKKTSRLCMMFCSLT